jgi:hypothetical protein
MLGDLTLKVDTVADGFDGLESKVGRVVSEVGNAQGVVRAGVAGSLCRMCRTTPLSTSLRRR